MKRGTRRKDLFEEELEFIRSKDRKYHHQVRKVKPEYKQAKQQHYKDNKEHYYNTNRKSVLKSKYGITWDEYQDMFESQNGACAICEETEEGRMLVVDHNHQNDEVRGLLCGSCNRALGLFKDDPELLSRAKEYVS